MFVNFELSEIEEFRALVNDKINFYKKHLEIEGDDKAFEYFLNMLNDSIRLKRKLNKMFDQMMTVEFHGQEGEQDE